MKTDLRDLNLSADFKNYQVVPFAAALGSDLASQGIICK